MNSKIIKSLTALLGLLLISTAVSQLSAAPMGTVFTYQGKLNVGTNAANGVYDFSFALFDAASGGAQQGSTIAVNAVPVANGCFMVNLDFGNVFPGAARWLSISVKTNGSGTYTALTPLQHLTPTPYSLFASDTAAFGGQAPSYYAPASGSTAYVAKSGDTMTGTLNLPANGLVAGSSQLVLSGGNVGIGTASPAARLHVAGSVSLNGCLNLPATTGSSGIIYSGANRLIHAYGTANFFAGVNAGSLTASSYDNTGVGVGALQANDGGNDNTAIGQRALTLNSIGSANVASGSYALFHNTSGNNNTACGYSALYYNTVGNENTANGYAALSANTSGYGNTATGARALSSNTNGIWNTANGYEALASNTSGYENTASGYQALRANTTGRFNTANGWWALYANISGQANTATGDDALRANTTGSENTADGFGALSDNTTGEENTAIGCYALSDSTNGFGNTAVGWEALSYCTGGQWNTALGKNAGIHVTTGSYNIEIGNEGNYTDDHVIRLGAPGVQTATFIGGIYGAVAASGAPVYVNSSGQLGTMTSSARFKEHIEDMAEASTALYALKPVTFQYKVQLDPQQAPQFGLVAEEVEKADPALVVHDDQGQPYTVRYEAVNAMLLNEFLKEHRKVEQLEARVEKLERLIRALDRGTN